MKVLVAGSRKSTGRVSVDAAWDVFDDDGRQLRHRLLILYWRSVQASACTHAIIFITNTRNVFFTVWYLPSWISNTQAVASNVCPCHHPRCQHKRSRQLHDPPRATSIEQRRKHGPGRCSWWASQKLAGAQFKSHFCLPVFFSECMTLAHTCTTRLPQTSNHMQYCTAYGSQPTLGKRHVHAGKSHANCIFVFCSCVLHLL